MPFTLSSFCLHLFSKYIRMFIMPDKLTKDYVIEIRNEIRSYMVA